MEYFMSSQKFSTAICNLCTFQCTAQHSTHSVSVIVMPSTFITNDSLNIETLFVMCSTHSMMEKRSKKNEFNVLTDITMENRKKTLSVLLMDVATWKRHFLCSNIVCFVATCDSLHWGIVIHMCIILNTITAIITTTTFASSHRSIRRQIHFETMWTKRYCLLHFPLYIFTLNCFNLK